MRLVPELTEYRKGRDIILTLREGCGDTIFEACDLQDDGICLVKAAAIIRNEIFRWSEESNEKHITKEIFSKTSKKHSVSQAILSFLDVVLNGSHLVVNHRKDKNETTLTVS